MNARNEDSEPRVTVTERIGGEKGDTRSTRMVSGWCEEQDSTPCPAKTKCNCNQSSNNGEHRLIGRILLVTDPVTVTDWKREVTVFNVLDRIRGLKAELSPALENPLLCVQAALKEVGEVRRDMMQTSRLSWPELLEQCRTIDPALTDRVITVFDELDTGIDGRYVDEFVTKEFLDDYFMKLSEWKRLSMQMLQMVSKAS